MNLDLTYKNPFLGINANHFEDDKILDYWCDPFAHVKPTPLHESNMFLDDTPIVITGGRGTGKTMILRYLSYDVQIEEAKRKRVSPKQHFGNKGAVGIYLKIEGTVLKSFEGPDFEDGQWLALFTHYFELRILELYIDFISKIILGGIDKRDIDTLLGDVKIIIHNNSILEFDTNQIMSWLTEEINKVTHLFEESAKKEIIFNYKYLYNARELSVPIGKAIKKYFKKKGLSVNVLILLDEYENYDQDKQKIINTSIKFTEPGVTYRIGTRLNGFNTLETVNLNEYLREGDDYREYVFENFLAKEKSYRDFIKKIAQKRLESVPFFNTINLVDIESLLGPRMDFKEDARELVSQSKNRYLHMTKYLKANKAHYSDEYMYDIIETLKAPRIIILNKTRAREYELGLREKVLRIIGNTPRIIVGDEEIDNFFKLEVEINDYESKRGGLLSKYCIEPNPLFEMLNMLWFRRGEKVETIKAALVDYIKREDTELGLKYRNDYEHKYKYALFQLLANLYDADMVYYGFNTFCFLSSGIARRFIELCKESLDHAYFKGISKIERDRVLNKESQTMAAYAVANNEIGKIDIIPEHGTEIEIMANNIGCILNVVNRDYELRYPETNQFAIELGKDQHIRRVINLAERWSVIQRKHKKQPVSPRGPKETIWTLNRIYAPMYAYSWRTRGGVNIKFIESQVSEMISKRDYYKKWIRDQRSEGDPSQLKIF